MDKLQKKLVYYAVFIVVAQIVNSYTVRILKVNTVVFFDVYLIIQFAYFIWFFNLWRRYGKLAFYSSILGLLLILILEYYQYFVFSDSYKGVSYTIPILFVLFIVQNAVVILKTFDLSDTEFNKSYVFWVAFSNLIYFMAILPFNIYGYFITELDGDELTLYKYTDGAVNILANFVLNAILMYSFSCRKS